MSEDKAQNVSNKSYRPPNLIRIFLDFLIEAVENKSYPGWKVTLVVENFRALYYIGFLWTIIIGMFLTTMFVDVDHTEIIMDVFGGQNLCTYLDFPPATYFTPLVFSFAILTGIIYIILSISRLNIAYYEKKISSRAKKLLITGHTYFIISVIWFATSLAVQPDRAEPVTMRFHAVPYINLKIATVSLQYCVVWFGTKVAWNSINFSSNGKKLFFFLSWLHWYLMIVETGLGCLMILNGIGDMGPSGLVGRGLFWNVRDPPRFAIARIVGLLFGNKSPLGDMVVAILIPMIQSMIVKFKSLDHISSTHTVTFYIHGNIFV